MNRNDKRGNEEKRNEMMYSWERPGGEWEEDEGDKCFYLSNGTMDDDLMSCWWFLALLLAFPFSIHKNTLKFLKFVLRFLHFKWSITVLPDLAQSLWQHLLNFDQFVHFVFETSVCMINKSMNHTRRCDLTHGMDTFSTMNEFLTHWIQSWTCWKYFLKSRQSQTSFWLLSL